MSTKIASIETNPYNKGHLSGRYAARDLADAGILTNVILSNPIRFRMSQTGNTVTLKKGSTLTIPNGLTQQGYVNNTYMSFASDLSYTLSNDIVIGEGAKNYRYLVYDFTHNRLVLASTNMLETNPYGITINIEQNIITFNRDNSRVSFPLGYFSSDREFHAFNSIGFYESKVWADKGVNILIADGRSNTSTLAVFNKTITELSLTDLSTKSVNAGTKNVLILRSNGEFDVVSALQYSTDFPGIYLGTYLTYSSNDNYIYDGNKNVIRACNISYIDTEDNGMIVALYDFNVYKTVSFNEMLFSIEENLEQYVDQLTKQLDEAAQ